MRREYDVIVARWLDTVGGRATVLRRSRLYQSWFDTRQLLTISGIATFLW